ncbi:MAG: polyhydroxyalkanoate depolymerase, partial [Rickettsiales bacterium]
MFNNLLENKLLYSFVEMYKANSAPFRAGILASQEWIESPYNPLSYILTNRTVSATYELFERLTRDYPKPEFEIHQTIIDGKEYHIEQEIVMQKAFCDLIHFRKFPEKNLPKLLIVAPMSGHYATLLRGSVQDTLPFFDVYITDWRNVRDLPLIAGSFDLDDYIDYCIEFMGSLSPNLSVMAVCQPAVPVMAAISIMSAQNPKDPKIPTNVILLGGPIDSRISPTEVNNYAANKDIQWFEHNVISMVPLNYPGCGREVYPGFLQLAGFMSMNMKRHVGEHIKLFEHLIVGDEDSAEKQIKFYDEYLAVMDLPADFYLQTIKEVFIKHSLPKGIFVSRGRCATLNTIKKSALLVLEGELDDITGRNQTKAAIDLCSNIPSNKKEYHLQMGVGHYGLFNGSKFRGKIV